MTTIVGARTSATCLAKLSETIVGARTAVLDPTKHLIFRNGGSK
jgi:hypothetical protein